MFWLGSWRRRYEYHCSARSGLTSINCGAALTCINDLGAGRAHTDCVDPDKSGFTPMKSTRTVVALCLLACSALAGAQSDPLPLRINGRTYALPADTPILVNGEPGVLADTVHLRDGMQVEWQTPAASGIEGVAPPLIFSYTLIGPVTSTAPLALLGQPLTVTGDTVLGFFSDPATLTPGQQLVVSGLVDANGSLLATLIEKRAAPGNKFLLSGYVQELGVAAGSVRVGALWVDAPGVSFQGCQNGAPAIGDYLQLRATAVDPFPPGVHLTTVFDALCATPAPPGTVGATGFLQGMISAVPAAGSFEIGALGVTYTALTEFFFGGVDDLGEGVAVVVDGSYVDALHFAAVAVEFVRPVVRFQAPLTPSQVIPQQSASPFGVLVRTSAQLRDRDNIMANGLAQARQVEVRGYLDGSGQAFATRIRDRGTADFTDTQLRGPVQNIADPLLTIQGLTVDTTGATFADHDGNPLTRVQFFVALQQGDTVDAAAAVYHPATQTLDAGVVTLIGTEPVPPPPVSRQFAAIVAGTASGYALPEIAFANGFE
jgi:hypothetical protein